MKAGAYVTEANVADASVGHLEKVSKARGCLISLVKPFAATLLFSTGDYHDYGCQSS